MSKVLKFKVEIEGLENKIWRILEITNLKTVADLAYTILATFDSLAYHLYDIKHGNDKYDCMIEPLNELDDYHFKDAVRTKLKDVDFNSNKKMIMDYDFGSTTTFIITYLDSRELEKGTGRHYPYIIDGMGRGMLDDITGDELKEIVDDIDTRGKSIHNFTSGYQRKIKYDYRDYKIDLDNRLLKGFIEEIKYGYEVGK